ncbi:MAG: YraN family protein [Desulfurobacteriaceae bacterium]
MGEEIASRLLQKKGYRIIARNFTSYWGEIDIVALEPETETLVFVEVRLRKNSDFGHPLETIDSGKVERIKKTALLFLEKNPTNWESVRFDVIAILGEEVIHIPNAF